MRLVLATANPDKAREIIDALEAVGAAIEVSPRPPHVPDVDETGQTLEENARLKACTLAGATGLPALADDTGLEVDALGGAPGVRSSRFAGEQASYADNVAKLLAEMATVPPGERTARFATVAMVAWPGGAEVVARGEVEGTIATAARGREGFGYDPVFVPVEGDGRTFAEMTLAEKQACSHRGRAVRALAARLAEGAA